MHFINSWLFWGRGKFLASCRHINPMNVSPSQALSAVTPVISESCRAGGRRDTAEVTYYTTSRDRQTGHPAVPGDLPRRPAGRAVEWSQIAAPAGRPRHADRSEVRGRETGDRRGGWETGDGSRKSGLGSRETVEGSRETREERRKSVVSIQSGTTPLYVSRWQSSFITRGDRVELTNTPT